MDQVIGNIRVAFVSVIVLLSWRKMSLLFCVRVCFLKIKILFKSLSIVNLQCCKNVSVFYTCILRYLRVKCHDG